MQSIIRIFYSKASGYTPLEARLTKPANINGNFLTYSIVDESGNDIVGMDNLSIIDRVFVVALKQEDITSESSVEQIEDNS